MAGCREVAIVGVGHSDFVDDYRSVPSDGGLRRTVKAIRLALADCGLTPADVSAVGCAGDLMKDSGGISRAVFDQARLAPKHVRRVSFLGDVAELARDGGVSLAVYSTVQRSSKQTFGGEGSAEYMPSYGYYHPWGFSSQGAHWALMFDAYRGRFPVRDDQLAQVAVCLRQHAALNPFAVMRTTITTDDYLAAPFVCRPLRRLDYCLPNDGSVAIVLTTARRARDLDVPCVYFAGRGSRTVSDQNDLGQMRTLILDGMHDLLRSAATEALAAARVTLADIDHFQTYDASSVHIPMSLEAAGFCKRGEGFEFVADGGILQRGTVPTNTSGGMLSESYLHGWNLHVEAVRQLRGLCAGRQVANARSSLYTQFWSGGAESHVLLAH